MSSNSYGSLAEVYDIFTKNVDYAKRAEYVDGIFKKVGVTGTVLDAGCGTGSLSLLLRKKGYEFVCADSSVEMLSLASNKFQENGFFDVTLLNQDLRELDLFGTIQGCVSMLDVINHIPSLEDIKTVFSKISLFSEIGAPFIFDMNLPYKHTKILADNGFKYSDFRHEVIWENELKEEPDRVEETLYVYRKKFFGKELVATDLITEYTYYLGDIRAMLTETGFQIGDIIDGDNYSTLTEKSQRALITCYKVK